MTTLWIVCVLLWIMYVVGLAMHKGERKELVSCGPDEVRVLAKIAWTEGEVRTRGAITEQIHNLKVDDYVETQKSIYVEKRVREKIFELAKSTSDEDFKDVWITPVSFCGDDVSVTGHLARTWIGKLADMINESGKEETK